MGCIDMLCGWSGTTHGRMVPWYWLLSLLRDIRAEYARVNVIADSHIFKGFTPHETLLTECRRYAALEALTPCERAGSTSVEGNELPVDGSLKANQSCVCVRGS